MKRFLLAITVLLLTAVLAAAQSFVRVIVLDTSGSMEGERLDTAKAEILALAKQLLPSKDHPIILVPFNHAPHSVGTFTDLLLFEAHLRQLKAGGGTSIASGLNRGIEEMKAYAKSANVCFLLYTDGEDGDERGIAAAEEQLDGLFAARKKQGLPSLVFMKRWENANAPLLDKFIKRGNTIIIDGRELKLVPVTLTPAVQLLKASWAKDQPLVLEVEAQAQLGMSGIPYDPSFPAAPLRCTDPGAVLPPVALRPGDPKPVAFCLRLPVPAATAATSKTVVHFTVGPVGHHITKGGVVLPQLPDGRVELPVPLPPLSFRTTFQASLAAAQPPAWADPLGCKPVQRLTLTCKVQSVPDQPWPVPVTFRLKPKGCRLVAGSDSFQMRGAGSVSVPVSLEADPVTAGVRDFTVGLVVRPEPPAGIAVEPAEVFVSHAGAVPASVDTRITARVQSVSEAQWIDLARGVALFRADVVFEVDGPLPERSKFVLVCPSAVRGVVIDPAYLRSGTQTIRLTVQAHLPAAPGVTQLHFPVQPPPVTGAVRVSGPGPLKLRVPGPAAVQVALVGRDGASPSVTVRDRSAPVVLTGVPVLLSPVDPQASSGVTVLIRGGTRIGLQSSDALPLDVPVSLPVRLENAETSFFFDSTIMEEIEVLPGSPTPALVGSCQTCAVTLEAPFKRACFYLAITIAGLALVFLVVRVLLRLSSENGN